MDYLIDESVALPLQECHRLIYKAQSPYMPMTLSLYRSIAHKKFKSMLMKSIDNGSMVSVKEAQTNFSKRVDLDILDKQFYHVLVE